MLSKVKFAVFAAAFCGSVAIGGAACAVTFDDLDIIGGDLYLVNSTASTITTSGVAGSLELEDWDTYNAETYADSIADPSDYVGPPLGVTSVFDPNKPDPSGVLSGLLVFVQPSFPSYVDWPPFSTYLSGDLIETRQVGLRVMEALFLRTDDLTVPNFGDYLIIRFTTSSDLDAAGSYSTSDIKIYGAVESFTGVPLPGAMVFMMSGVAGLAALRRMKQLS